MADDNSSFWGGLMAGINQGVNDLPTNGLFNIGMGLVSASKPFGNIGDSLMEANRQTLGNQLVRQRQGMGALQMRQAQAEFPLRMTWLQHAMDALQPPQGGAPSPQGVPSSPQGVPQNTQGAPGPMQMPGGPGIDPMQSVNLGLAGGALGMPGASEFLKAPEAMGAVQKFQQQQRQMAAQGPMALLKSVSSSPAADVIVQNDPNLAAQYKQDAPRLGFPADPTKMTVPQARTWAAFAHNNLAGPAGLPPVDMPTQVTRVNRGNGDVRDIDPLTGKDVGGSPAVATSKFVKDGKVVELPTAQAVAQGLQPYDAALYGASQITLQALEQAWQQTKASGTPPAQAGRDPIAFAQETSYIAKRAKEEGITGLALTAQQQSYKAQQGVVNDFTSGDSNKKLIAINTAVKHLNALDPLIAAMQNSNMTAINKAKQEYQRQTGKPAPTNYQALANMAVGEVSTAINKTGGDSGERETIAAPFRSYGSPDVLRGAVSQAATALAGKTDALENSWNVGTNGTQGKFSKFLMPETVKALGWTLHTDAKGKKAYVSPDGTQFKEVK